MAGARALLVVALLVAVSLGQILPTPPPGLPAKPVWPEQFDSPFGLNWSLLGDKLIVNATSHLYYDYTIEAQLIDYPELCFPFAFPGSFEYPCQLLFIPSGIYVTAPDAGIDCCLLDAGVGTVPPEFLRAFIFKDVEDANDWYGNTYECNHWVSGGGFAYWTSMEGLDIQFKDDDTGVYWNFGPFNVEAQDPSLFDLPAGNCSSPCFPTGSDPKAELRPYQNLFQRFQSIRH
mmetsp:Transcript_19596/g.75226  ORF Transcript_19596/g.75226 Transcript_19596/m.75226 type:complete len:232 (-) Transcript_19596:76-771(-)|eukprot:CAMPEP_0114620114 /NCGR_PEP_ID=MMETSP0168-20121206/8555_1 /TAXON_ID=95228 ORGANISM="Vannella sp., Strain DIVA3 517/6/12" /NCGR_SAMPLE_ID=MMETSP0168 /ASSEMBLY_ACC=CAM_ASM_000044 /LENGTH=231 /DNA_ID=CAMNT_0001831289 /DNA_START=28 /DNA_END=723 /DNA_ORIENTATION=+